MQLAIYNALKARIETLAALKYVALWNNQFEREDVNVPFNYPCCFIEFASADYIENLQGQQQGTLSIALHLGFESYKTEDTAVLQLKQDLNALVHNWSTPYNSRFLRRSEIQSADHTNIQEFIITYTLQGFDYSASSLPTTEALVTTLITNNAPQLEDDTIRSGAIPEAVALASELGYILTTETGYNLIIQQ
ncbi:hypothetical protein [Flavobacterium sp.]|jgi:hypothetical protein|uniref:hypothetical protein n=1 Tax=Flavobacterium sp. TaxID=239 RepID=UPI00391DB356